MKGNSGPSQMVENAVLDGFAITAVTKLKHAAIYAAARRIGSQSALASHLGVSRTYISRWINLQAAPPESPSGRFWTESRISEIEAKLITLTGMGWDELWPPELRAGDFLKCSKTIIRTEVVRRAALEAYSRHTLNRLQAYATGDCDADARSDRISESLSTLRPKDRLVIEMLFGLDGEGGKTLSEVADALGLSRVRVGQLKGRAIRTLQLPSVSRRLLEFCD